MNNILTIVLAFALLITGFISARDLARLQKENDRLRSVVRELRKQMAGMVERPF